MTQERIEAAARAAAKDEDASNWEDEHDYYRNGWCNRMAVGIEAADDVLFSDEAIERAAKLLCAANNLDFDYWERYPEDSLIKAKYRDQARAVVAALKGDA